MIFDTNSSNSFRCLLLSLIVFATTNVANAQLVVISFDETEAPNLFLEPTPLSNEFSSLGVTFEGPTKLSGGAILNDSSFSVSARSGANFLAFNGTPGAAFPSGGFPIGPETLLFDTNITEFSSGPPTSLMALQIFQRKDFWAIRYWILRQSLSAILMKSFPFHQVKVSIVWF